MKLGFRLFSVLTFLMFMGGITLYAQDDATAASLYNDGVAALKGKEYDKALDLMTQALEKADPQEDEQIVKLASQNGAVAAYYAGGQARKAGNIDEAIEIYQKGIEFSEAFYANYSGLALAYNSKEMSAEAMDAYIIGSQMAAKAGKADVAEKYLDNATVFVSKAYSDKNWDDAIALGNEFLENDDSADVHYYVARAYNKKGQGQEALEHATKAVELGEGGKEGRNFFALAESYEAVGNTSAAMEAYKKVPAGQYGDMAKYKLEEMAN